MIPEQIKTNASVLVTVLALSLSCLAQSSDVKEINAINTAVVGLAPLRFLASDELMGRDPFRPEINIAARYISEQFRSMGIREVKGTTDYFQNFDLKSFIPAQRDL